MEGLHKNEAFYNNLDEFYTITDYYYGCYYGLP